VTITAREIVVIYKLLVTVPARITVPPTKIKLTIATATATVIVWFVNVLVGKKI
jgi:hypothetical protein